MQIKRRLLKKALNSIGYSLSPRDRILSAISKDGIIWLREQGVRHDAGGLHSNEMVYYCHVIPLYNDGYRMYYHGSIMTRNGWRGRILSAVSKDGLIWKDEPATRIDYGGKYDEKHARAPSLCRLHNGCFRMYYSGFDSQGIGRILSAISRCGITWKKEEGVRLEPSVFTETKSLIDCCIVSLGMGTYRLYVSAAKNSLTNIRSAVSFDGLHWKAEQGIRVRSGYLGRKLVVNNPSVITAREGWRMYFRGGDKLALGNDIYWASSANGLDWCVQGIALKHEKKSRHERHAVAFPFVSRLIDGRWRMFYTGYWGRHWKEHRIITAWEKATEVEKCRGL